MLTVIATLADQQYNCSSLVVPRLVITLPMRVRPVISYHANMVASKSLYRRKTLGLAAFAGALIVAAVTSLMPSSGLCAPVDERTKQAELYWKKGKACLEKDPHGAVSYFNQANHLDPNHSIALYDRGRAYMRLGNVERAKQDFELSISENHDQKAICDLAAIYDKNEDFDHALSLYTEAIKIDPKNNRAYAQRGDVYLKLGKLDAALVDLDKAEQLYPKDLATLKWRAQTLHLMKRDNEAIKGMTKAIARRKELKQKYDWELTTRARYYTSLKDYKHAEEDWQDVMKMGVNDRGTVEFVDVELKLGKPRAAIPLLDKLIVANPNNDEAYLERAVVYYELKEYLKALKDYKQVLNLDSEEIRARQGVAKCYDRLNQHALAAAAWKEVTQASDRERSRK